MTENQNGLEQTVANEDGFVVDETSGGDCKLPSYADIIKSPYFAINPLGYELAQIQTTEESESDKFEKTLAKMRNDGLWAL